MNLGAFFATLLAIGPAEPAAPPPQVAVQPPAIERSAPAVNPIQLAAVPPESDPEAAPPAPPVVTPKAPRPAAKGTTGATKPSKTTAARKPAHKPQATTKPRSGKPVATSCPAGSAKNPTTGRCAPRTTATPRV